MSPSNSVRRKAPYAPAASVVASIKRYRERGLPEPIDASVLESIGISHGVAQVTLAALKFLGLINADGNHTERFDALRRVSSEDYPNELLGILQSAYTDVFVIVDPSQDSRDRIEDAFRQYDPPAQRDRMISLFIALCKEASLFISEGTKQKPEKRNQTERQQRPRTVSTAKTEGANSPSDAPLFPNNDGEKADSRVSFDLITALLRQLPLKGKWTSAQRQRWIKALEANIDLIIEVTSEESQ